MRNRKHFASFPDKFSDTYDSHTSENDKIPGLPGATRNSEKKVKTTSQKFKIKLPSDIHTYQQQTGMMHRSIELEKNRQESISSRCEIDNIYFPKSSPNSLNCWSKIFSKKKNDNCLNDSMEIDCCKSVYSDITPTLVEYGLLSIYKVAEQDRIKKMRTCRLPFFFRKNEGGVPNIGMLAEGIEGMLIHIEVSVARC